MVMQASRKVRPILEQAAAAAAAVADTEGAAKAQAAAKKARKLTPEEMNKMRQQADPNYQAKKAATPSNSAAPADGPSKKAKKGKAAASKPQPASDNTANQASATTSGGDKLANATAKPEAAATHAAAQAASQAAADHGAASGSKRRQGLGFAEEQPTPKRAKQEPSLPSPSPAASSDTGPVQHAQAASDKQQQGPGKVTDEQQSKTQPGLQSQVVATQATVASSGAQGQGQGQGQGQSAAVASSGAQGQGQRQGQGQSAAAPGPPVVFTDECTAFVRGMDNKVTEDELRELLAECGDIKGVRLVKDKVTGLFKVGACYCQLGVMLHEQPFSVCTLHF